MMALCRSENGYFTNEQPLDNKDYSQGYKEYLQAIEANLSREDKDDKDSGTVKRCSLVLRKEQSRRSAKVTNE